MRETHFTIGYSAILPFLLSCASSSFVHPPENSCVLNGEYTEADAERAISACKTAQERFALLLGVPAPPGTLHLGDDPINLTAEVKRDRWHLGWPSDADQIAVAQRLGEADPHAYAAEQWRSTLPHEIGHAMLAASLYPGEPASVVGRYGSDLPDWIDEAVALWMEPEDEREQRQVILQTRLSTLPPLDRLLSATHPESEREERVRFTTNIVYACPRAELCPDRPHSQKTMSVTRWMDRAGRLHVDTLYFNGPLPERDPIAEYFYPLSLAAISYVHDRGGADAARLLLQRLRRGAEPAGAMVGLPGLHGTHGALEQDWQTWSKAWLNR